MGRYTNRRVVRRVKDDQKLGNRNYVGTKYPRIPKTFEDTYVYAEQGDRFDTLALQYYGNSEYWWVISIANEDLKQDSYYLPLNQQIRIPVNIANIVSTYNLLNGAI
jgi:hypothetical protein|tara:strand:- start:4846 stop:5166 length:321 start_codon:yes stop_codon:yes gene_type:complete